MGSGSYGYRRTLLLMLVMAVALMGCSAAKPPVSCQALNAALLHGDFPRTIAVLPFANHTNHRGLDQLVRQSFASQVSHLPYRDIELSQIDRKLRRNGINDQTSLYKATVADLAGMLNCDALIYGDVIEFRRVFAGIYSSLSVRVSVRVWDTRTGRKVWEDEQTVSSREGGVPLAVLDLPMIGLRSGMNLRGSEIIRVVDQLSRRLTARFPSPPVTHRDSSRYELQIAAFIDEDRAQSLREELEISGYDATIRRERHAGNIRTWFKVLLGPFTSRREALLVKQKIDHSLGSNSFVCRISS